MEPALSTVAVARQVCAAVSGRFAGGSRDNCLATVEEGGAAQRLLVDLC